MFRRHQPQENHFEDIDEGGQPTEPMAQIILLPSSPTAAGAKPTDVTIPAPKLQESVSSSPSSSVPESSDSVYPFLPPAPGLREGNRPPGGMVSVESTDREKARPGASDRPRRSSFPLFVGVFFVALQLLLLVRFILKVLDLPGMNNQWWVNGIYDISSVFVFPFRFFLENVNWPVHINPEVYTLLAILIYGLLSRILVRFLKALLHSR